MIDQARGYFSDGGEVAGDGRRADGAAVGGGGGAVVLELQEERSTWGMEVQPVATGAGRREEGRAVWRTAGSSAAPRASFTKAA